MVTVRVSRSSAEPEVKTIPHIARGYWENQNRLALKGFSYTLAAGDEAVAPCSVNTSD